VPAEVIMPSSDLETFDVVIIGAGLSGINAAYRLQQDLPSASFVILEAKNVVGGTWSFWKYPGARTDSSLALFGLPWFPWPDEFDFAPAGRLARYIEEAAAYCGADRKTRFRHKVLGSSWSSEEQRWTLDVRVGGEDEATGSGRQINIKASWILNCTGYYSYEKPQEATIPGIDNFGGEVVHPQFWTDGISWKGKRVVVVGSGATAITMVPSLVEDAAHVTMLQRSPSYVMAMPQRSAVSAFLQRWLPARWAAWLNFCRQIVLENLFVQTVMRHPNFGRRLLKKAALRYLPKGYDYDVHFNPRYAPFDQRPGFAPDGNFLKALGRPDCEIVTDVIDTVTASGIRLRSGKFIQADMLITATGLYVQLLDGMTPLVDGEPARVAGRHVWRSCMIDGLPNAASIVGYTYGTWTPGADIHTSVVLEVMKHARAVGATSATPTLTEAQRRTLPRNPAIPNSSGYLVRAHERLPVSAGVGPWYNGIGWFYDLFWWKVGGVKTGMRYTIPDKRKKET